MPPLRSVVAPSLPTLHLYRNLLREISYLPPAFSGIIADQVRHQFHQHTKKSPHTKRRLARARSGLRSIIAANHGDTKSMFDLISKGFGREGRRRRQLLSQFVISRGANDSSSLETLLNQHAAASGEADGTLDPTNSSNDPEGHPRPEIRRKHRFLDRWDRPKILQFLKSQQEAQAETKDSAVWKGGFVKKVDENAGIPDKSTWGKPLPENLRRTKQAKWWKRNADKIKPPLGKGEWDLLQRLSSGAQAKGEWAVPPRRTSARPTHPDAETARSDWDWEAYATHSSAFVERPRKARLQRRTGENEENPYRGRSSTKMISDRWFRRAYTKTWQKSAYVEQDPNTLKYTFSWGARGSPLPAAGGWQRAIFEGVDNNGQSLKKTTESSKP